MRNTAAKSIQTVFWLKLVKKSSLTFKVYFSKMSLGFGHKSVRGKRFVCAPSINFQCIIIYGFIERSVVAIGNGIVNFESTCDLFAFQLRLHLFIKVQSRTELITELLCRLQNYFLTAKFINIRKISLSLLEPNLLELVAMLSILCNSQFN